MPKIEIGAVYRTRSGAEAWIAGHTRRYPDFVWSTQGDWYRQSDGRYVSYRVIRNEKGRDVGGEHFVPETELSMDLVEKIRDSWK